MQNKLHLDYSLNLNQHLFAIKHHILACYYWFQVVIFLTIKRLTERVIIFFRYMLTLINNIRKILTSG